MSKKRSISHINTTIETQYPLGFREAEAKELGNYVKNRQSVVLIGMKRVGISNFLRFFLNHDGVVKKYIGGKDQHLFIPVDLNDLVEREFFPFWMLTSKRIVDAIEQTDISISTKKQVEALFLDSIQSQNLFLLIENIRLSLNKIIEEGFLPTIFFIRFDRMRDHATKEFLYNLIGLKDASHNKLSFVFTTYRRLDHLSPKVFNTTSLALTSNRIYFKPARQKDLEIIFQAYTKRSNLKLPSKIKEALFELSDGYVQFMQLGLIILHETEKLPKDKQELFNLLLSDERMTLQSEELWESLNEEEKEVLVQINNKGKVSEKEKETAKYLWETGLVTENNKLFSPLFSSYLNRNSEKKTEEVTSPIEFSKKEHSLFNFLQKNINQICERESIIGAVWPEEEALGVSDWAIDRLVARVRNKLKQQNSQFEIVTVKTRGYKLTSTSAT